MPLPADQLQFLLKLSPLTILAGVVLAAGGSLAVSATTLALASGPKRVFKEKFAFQMLNMSLPLWALSLLFCLGGSALAYLKYPALALFWLKLPWPFLGLAAPLALGTIALVAYRALWPRYRDGRALGVGLGVLGSLGFFSTLFMASVYVRYFSLPASQGPELPAIMTLELGPAFWLLFALVFCLSLGVSGNFGLTWLIYRREKDDYGRDYYFQALKMAALWALLPGLAAMGASSLLYFFYRPFLGPQVSLEHVLYFLCAGLGSLVLSGICEVCVLRSENPLRQKPWIFTAALLTLLGLAGLMAGFFNMFLL